MKQKLPFKYLRLKEDLSESGLAAKAGLSRIGYRTIESGLGNPTLTSLSAVAQQLDRYLEVHISPNQESDPEFSVYAVSLAVVRDSNDSWVYHFMDFVDYFRKMVDANLIALPPSKKLDPKHQAMLNSIVIYLCEEVGMAQPKWCQKSFFLEDPWFPSEVQSLKAMAIRDSHWAFRKNNIFVLDNFMKRA